MCRTLYCDDVKNGWLVVSLKRTLSVIICCINSYLLNIREHGLWPCNVEDVEHWCMMQEMLVQVQCQGKCRSQYNWCIQKYVDRFFLTRKIRIQWVNGRSGVDREYGTIRSHVGNLVCCVDWKLMSNKFSGLKLA